MTGPCELYDLEADIGEQRDLAAAEPAVVEHLQRELDDHLADAHALISQRNPWPEPFA